MAATLPAPPPPMVEREPEAPPIRPVADDMADVRRRFAQAAALFETATARVRTLQGTVDSANSTKLARLEAARDLPAARVEEAKAEIVVLTLQAEETRVRDELVAERKARAKPLIKAALANLDRRLLAAREAQDELLALLEQVQGALGPNYGGWASECLFQWFVKPPHASEDAHTFWRQWLRGQGWLD